MNRLIIIFTVIFCFGFIVDDSNPGISYNGINGLTLGTPKTEIKHNLIRDTSYFGNGFEYLGGYYGKSNHDFLVEFAYHDTTVSRITTFNSNYSTSKNIHVNSTLNDLSRTNSQLGCVSITNEYQDFYLYEDSLDSRIEYRFDSKLNTLESLLFPNDLVYPLNDNSKFKSVVLRIGDITKIKSISVVNTSN